MCCIFHFFYFTLRNKIIKYDVRGMKYDVLPLASVKCEVESTKDQPHQPSNFNLQTL